MRDDGSFVVKAVYPEGTGYVGRWARSTAMGTVMVAVPTCRDVPSRQSTTEETASLEVQLMWTGAGGKGLDV